MLPALIASVLHYSPQCGLQAKHHFQLPLFRFTFVSLSAQLAATFITPTLTPLPPFFLSSFFALSLSFFGFRLARQSVYLFSFSCSALSMLCIALPSGKKPLPTLTATPTRRPRPLPECILFKIFPATFFLLPS